MAKRKGQFRTRLKRNGRNLFAIRDKLGRFVNIESVSKAQKADRRKKAKRTVKPGQGWRGDQKRRK
ncbi:MAG TPA: hypothetical protein VJJ78_00475 [Candidatus Saccharimonadales bacterium]|nr:hypothetical protein [Candidatus Saccharimonadales bacterium]